VRAVEDARAHLYAVLRRYARAAAGVAPNDLAARQAFSAACKRLRLGAANDKRLLPGALRHDNDARLGRKRKHAHRNVDAHERSCNGAVYKCVGRDLGVDDFDAWRKDAVCRDEAWRQCAGPCNGGCAQ
jgi:hypothetical protein